MECGFACDYGPTDFGSAEQGIKPALLLKDGSRLGVAKAHIELSRHPRLQAHRRADMYVHKAETAGFYEDGKDFEM